MGCCASGRASAPVAAPPIAASAPALDSDANAPVLRTHVAIGSRGGESASLEHVIGAASLVKSEALSSDAVPNNPAPGEGSGGATPISVELDESLGGDTSAAAAPSPKASPEPPLLPPSRLPQPTSADPSPESPKSVSPPSAAQSLPQGDRDAPPVSEAHSVENEPQPQADARVAALRRARQRARDLKKARVERRARGKDFVEKLSALRRARTRAKLRRGERAAEAPLPSESQAQRPLQREDSLASVVSEVSQASAASLSGLAPDALEARIVAMKRAWRRAKQLSRRREMEINMAKLKNAKERKKQLQSQLEAARRLSGSGPARRRSTSREGGERTLRDEAPRAPLVQDASNPLDAEPQRARLDAQSESQSQGEAPKGAPVSDAPHFPATGNQLAPLISSLPEISVHDDADAEDQTF